MVLSLTFLICSYNEIDYLTWSHRLAQGSDPYLIKKSDGEKEQDKQEEDGCNRENCFQNQKK